MLPNALAIGVPYETFWHLTPKKLEAFYKAYKLRLNERDMRQWQLGQYFIASIGTAFKGKYPKEPLFQLKTEAEKNLTEEEKQRQVDLFFKTENARRLNFKRNQNKDGSVS